MSLCIIALLHIAYMPEMVDLRPERSLNFHSLIKRGGFFCCMPYMACNFHIALNFVSRSVSGERTSHVADS